MFQSKLQVEETIFTTMSQLAKKNNAINLGQGFPDFEPSEELTSLVTEAMNNGYNQYVHQNGLLELREAISNKAASLYNTALDPNKNICVTPGATYAIYTALTTVLRPGDEVIIFDPAYDSYIPNIVINGAQPVIIPLTFPDFKIDWEKVRDSISQKTKMIMINSPHNPTGALLSKEDIAELTSLVNEFGLYVLSDEVYEHVVFDGKQHESVLKYPDLFRRSFVVFSFGKVYHCTGWKTGYCIAPGNLMNEFIKVHQFNAFCCFSPAQYAFAKYLDNADAYLTLGAFYETKRDLLSGQLEEAGFRSLPSHGSFFQLFDYSALSEANDLDFAKELTEKAGVSAIPISPFYSNKFERRLLRFCFAKTDETLTRAGGRLIQFYKN